ncbi:MAG: hypothetical protein FWF18_03315 [Dehalococcoidia bacterium]|nr:hypothetical protein [Dehalococcoidia bacterium]
MNLPSVFGQARHDGDSVCVGDLRMARVQGFGAMVSVALSITSYFRLDAPHVIVASDNDGEGSREIYSYLAGHTSEMSPEVLVLHRSLQDVAQFEKLRESGVCSTSPLLVAGAGMLSARGDGLAYIFRDDKLLASVEKAGVAGAELEGSEEVVIGMLSALAYTGLEPETAAVYAGRTYNAAAQTVAGIGEIIDLIPVVAKQNYCAWAGVCYTDNAK